MDSDDRIAGEERSSNVRYVRPVFHFDFGPDMGEASRVRRGEFEFGVVTELGESRHDRIHQVSKREAIGLRMGMGGREGRERK